MAVPGDEPYAARVATGDNAEAVMLDFMNPAGPHRRRFGAAGYARLETGRGTIGAHAAPKLTRY
jgi:hypothetical protein